MIIETSGVVTKTFSKAAGNRGGKTYSFILDDNGIWFNCGFDNPNTKEGDTVTFSYTEDEWAPGRVSNKVDVKSVVVEAGKAAPAKTASKPKGGKVQENWDARAAYWENKEKLDVIRQNTISYQAAFNTAMTQLTTMCNNNSDVYDYLVGNTKTQKKPGVQIENFTNQVEALAIDLLGRFIQGNDVVSDTTKEDVAVVDHTDGGNDLDD